MEGGRSDVSQCSLDCPNLLGDPCPPVPVFCWLDAEALSSPERHVKMKEAAA